MPHAPEQFTQVGLALSLYSGKTRSYLLHKRIPFVERGTNLWELLVTFPRRNRCSAVPVVITPEGEYLQDTSTIIDTLERRFPDRPVVPATPVLRLAAYLFELWGDEFWLPLAMHTRWSHRDENVSLFIHDVGEAMLGGFPRVLRNAIGRHYADKMDSYTPPLGVTAQSGPLLDRFLEIHLDALDAHFRTHPFLFGGRPSLGDFGMIAPLYAHIGRDPWSKRELVEPRPHLKAWIERMFEPESPARGEFQPEDALPETLAPALRSIFDEMVPFLAGCAGAVRHEPVLPATARNAKRFLGTVRYPMAGGVHERAALSYPVWMAQRLLGAFASMTLADRERVRAWLASVGGESLLKLDVPRVARVGLAAARVA